MAYLSKAGKMVTLKDTEEMKVERKFMGSLNLNFFLSFIPATDSNTANATKYIKSTRTAGFFMQSLSGCVNKEASAVPGHYKCPIEKLS